MSRKEENEIIKEMAQLASLEDPHDHEIFRLQELGSKFSDSICTVLKEYERKECEKLYTNLGYYHGLTDALKIVTELDNGGKVHGYSFSLSMAIRKQAEILKELENESMEIDFIRSLKDE